MCDVNNSSPPIYFSVNCNLVSSHPTSLYCESHKQYLFLNNNVILTIRTFLNLSVAFGTVINSCSLPLLLFLNSHETIFTQFCFFISDFFFSFVFPLAPSSSIHPLNTGISSNFVLGKFLSSYSTSSLQVTLTNPHTC